MRNEYKIIYEAPPVSEIPKLVFIKANNLGNAVAMFNNKEIKDAKILKAELYDEDVQ